MSGRGEGGGSRVRGRRSDGPVPSWKEGIFELFRGGASVERVMATTGRAERTVINYLTEFIERERPRSVAEWVGDDVYARVAGAAGEVGMARLRPIFEVLGGAVDYATINVVVAHLQAGAEEGESGA